MNKIILLVLFIIVSVVYADIYGHAPPFSNNRNQETGTNRDNANRLFNTQNNAKGGYCRGDALEWYEGSVLPIQWTVQHGCGSDETECNIVIQYMCSNSKTAAPYESIRDGTNTQTIAVDINQATERDAAGVYTYGLHESYYYYKNCTARERNRGLFTANQLNPQNSQNADRTRQNNGGTRYGYECQEERDYYPYWAPSPWKDIAIITDNTDHCKWYQSESQNVKSKYYCDGVTTGLATIDPKQCNNQGGTWKEVRSHGIGKPSCHNAEWTAVNHLGHTLNGGSPATFNWTLPSAAEEPCIATGTCSCVLRIRYNISTSDILGNGNGNGQFTDYRDNLNTSVSYDDPNIQLRDGYNVTININPNQYGRTFQDRTHVFRIKARTPSLRGKKIWNLLVKGKRGNIVNAYPAQEYMFVPHKLVVKKNEYIHFQWTGCDFNPQGNDGSGLKGTDRSNMVQIKSLNHNIPLKDSELPEKKLFPDAATRLRFALLDQDPAACKSYAQLIADNGNNRDAIEQDPQNCMFLNLAGTRFDGGAQKMSQTGTFYYMSTRNNNFSNRNQKGAIIVEPLLKPWQIGLIAAGCSLFVILSAVGGTVAFARFHPHSGANRLVSKVPGLKKLV